MAAIVSLAMICQVYGECASRPVLSQRSPNFVAGFAGFALLQRLSASRAAPLAPFIVRWGPWTSSDTLRRCARCSDCGARARRQFIRVGAGSHYRGFHPSRRSPVGSSLIVEVIALRELSRSIRRSAPNRQAVSASSGPRGTDCNQRVGQRAGE